MSSDSRIPLGKPLTEVMGLATRDGVGRVACIEGSSPMRPRRLFARTVLPRLGVLAGTRSPRSPHAFLTGLLLTASVTGCAMPKRGGAPPAPIERAWGVPTLELYGEWWRKTEECAGRKGDMSRVTFYAVDAPSGGIGLKGTSAHGWWLRQGNRIYLPPTRSARSGWCGTRCCTLCCNAARTRPSSSSTPATWRPSGYGATRRSTPILPTRRAAESAAGERQRKPKPGTTEVVTGLHRSSGLEPGPSVQRAVLELSMPGFTVSPLEVTGWP